MPTRHSALTGTENFPAALQMPRSVYLNWKRTSKKEKRNCENPSARMAAGLSCKQLAFKTVNRTSVITIFPLISLTPEPNLNSLSILRADLQRRNPEKSKRQTLHYITVSWCNWTITACWGGLMVLTKNRKKIKEATNYLVCPQVNGAKSAKQLGISHGRRTQRKCTVILLTNACTWINPTGRSKQQSFSGGLNITSLDHL